MDCLEKYKNKGLSGIINYGSTCYMNASIQSLSHTISLTDYFLSNTFQDKIRDKSGNIVADLAIDFSNQWYRLIDGLWEDNCTVSPKSLFSLLKKVCKKKKIDLKITEHIQNDIQEFFILILDLIHCSMSEKKDFTIVTGNKLLKESSKSWNEFFKDDYSIIIELFYGQIMTEIKDVETGKVLSNVFQPICFFPLPIDINSEHITLYDCFDEYLKEEQMEKHIVEGEERIVSKGIHIFRFPKIMIIILNRFNNDNTKKDVEVDFPLTLDMSRYNNNVTYDLYSICNHYGSSDMGHYTSYCKNNNK